VYGIDKTRVTQIVMQLRSIKPPEPYKGKGIRLKNEVVRRKEGKKK
jgi:large subunit ribosomal protein L6